jgi:hypothetical protein
MEYMELRVGGVRYVIVKYKTISRWTLEYTTGKSRYCVPYLHRRSQQANTAKSPSPVNTNTRPTCKNRGTLDVIAGRKEETHAKCWYSLTVFFRNNKYTDIRSFILFSDAVVNLRHVEWMRVLKDLEVSECELTAAQRAAFFRGSEENLSQDSRWFVTHSNQSPPEHNLEALSMSQITTGRLNYALIEEGWFLPESISCNRIRVILQQGACTYPVIPSDNPRGLLVRMPGLHPCWLQLLAASPEGQRKQYNFITIQHSIYVSY